MVRLFHGKRREGQIIAVRHPPFLIGLTPYAGYAGPLALGRGAIMIVFVFFCKFRFVLKLFEARRVGMLLR